MPPRPAAPDSEMAAATVCVVRTGSQAAGQPKQAPLKEIK